MRFSLKPHYVRRPAQGVRRLVQVLRRRSPDAAVVTLPWGLDMRVDPREAIGRSIWQLGLYDLAVSEVIWRLLEPGHLALDVGANIGYMTGLMAVRVGAAGEVHALEPHPEVFAALAENVARFRRRPGIAAIQALPLAISDVSGDATLYCGPFLDDNRGLASLREAAGPTFQVAARTLDEVLGSRTAELVKIDVEGCEGEVVGGAQAALREGRIRHLLYEASDAGGPALAAELRGYGYTVFAVGRNASRLLLSPPDRRPRLPRYEAPSHLATLDEGAARARLEPRGWQVLQRTKSPSSCSTRPDS